MLTFNDNRHEYTWDTGHSKTIVPSVSEIISPLYRGAFEKIPPAILERKTAIGKAAHAACEIHDKYGDLDPETLDESVVGYFNAWLKFLAEHRCEWELIEQPLYSQRHAFAGTQDRFGTVDRSKTVLDIKTVAVMNPITGVQLAGYEQLIRENTVGVPDVVQRIGLQLKPDGTYRMHTYAKNEWTTFLSCMNVHSFSSRNS